MGPKVNNQNLRQSQRKQSSALLIKLITILLHLFKKLTCLSSHLSFESEPSTSKTIKFPSMPLANQMPFVT